MNAIQIDRCARLLLRRGSRLKFVISSFVLVAAVGAADYWSGFERSLSVFYLVPVALAAWFVGRGFAVGICVTSVATWILGDIAAGAKYSSASIPVWNSLIALVSFLIVVWLVTRLRAVLDELEMRVQQRTLALEREVAARIRLEKEIAEVTERERQRVGHELHDSICQHLTGTSLAAQVLGGELDSIGSPLVASAEELVTLIESGIDLTRDLAHGLISLELQGEGLCGALKELAQDVALRSKIDCECHCDESIEVDDALTATHLFRIAQEAVNNAMKHSGATRIILSANKNNGGVCLSISDNGCGIATPISAERRGLGRKIMAHRAALIGASLELRGADGGGTEVFCRLAMQENLNGEP